MGATSTAKQTWDTAEKDVNLVIEHEYADTRTLEDEFLQGTITCKNQGEVNLLKVTVKVLVDDTLDFWDAIFYSGLPAENAKVLDFGNISAGSEIFLHYHIRLLQAADLPQGQATYDVILIPHYEVDYDVTRAEKYRTTVG